MSNLSWSKVHVQQLSHIQSLCCCVSWSINTKLLCQKCLTFLGQKFMSNSFHIYNHYAVVSINTKLKCLTFLGQKFMSNSFHIYNHYAVVSINTKQVYLSWSMSDLSWSKVHVQQLSHIQSLCCCVNKY